MNIRIKQNWRNMATLFFIALPIFSLFLNAISWLKFGIDLPYWDDWEILIRNDIDNFGWSHFFAPMADTLSPVGTGLDLLFYHYLSGNVIAYQFISIITVLGLLLFLQWKLLLLALKDRFLAAAAFSLTLFMLQPDTYWGIQYIAFHQALPLVFSLTAIYLILGQGWTKWSPVALIILALLSGFSYISGAFSILALSIIFIMGAQFIQPNERKPLLQGGLTLLGTSIITVCAQLWVVVIVRKGGTHAPGVSMANPFEIDFWLFFLGKIGRSLFLPLGHPLFYFIVTCLVVITTISLIIWSIRYIGKNKSMALSAFKPLLIYIALAGVIFVYLGLVSAGRTNFANNDALSWLETFYYGFSRFHFFWVTLLWPWVAAMIFIITKKRFLGILIPLIIIPYLIIAGALNHAEYYKNVMQHRALGLKCVIGASEKRQHVHCPQLHPGDLSDAILTAKTHDLSFTRIIDFPLPSHFLSLELKDFTFHNIETKIEISNGYHLRTGHDPMIFLETKSPEIMTRCNVLDVSILLRASEPSVGQVYYLISGQEHFSELASVQQPIQGDNLFHQIYFQFISKTGFGNLLRLDPVSQAQEIEIKNIEVNCLSY